MSPAGVHVRPSRYAPTRSATLLTLLAAAAAAAQAGEPVGYALDPVHTRVMFAVEHAGFSRALGTISGSTGSVLFDPEDWSTAQLDVRVPLTRLDLGDERWNNAVLARRLLHGDKYPEARFVGSGAQPLAPERARICGELTLRDVTRPLCMEVTLNAIKRHPLPPFRRTAGFSATATLSRADYGIDAWQSVIGDQVELRIEAEAVRDRDAAAALSADDGAPVGQDGEGSQADPRDVDYDATADGATEHDAVEHGTGQQGPMDHEAAEEAIDEVAAAAAAAAAAGEPASSTDAVDPGQEYPPAEAAQRDPAPPAP